MRRLYNALFFLFFLLSAPYYFTRLLRRGRWREGFRQRFGRYNAKLKQALTNRHVIWLHAVSVGEVNVCTQLIRAIEPRAPNLKIVVSTTTSTGMAELRRKLPSHIEKIYYPIDRRAWVRRAVSVIHPEAVIFVEAEIWPNFIWRLRDMRIPAFLVNARLSDRSYRGYRRFGFLFRPLFASFEGVGAQNEADAARLRELGCRPEASRSSAVSSSTPPNSKNAGSWMSRPCWDKSVCPRRPGASGGKHPPRGGTHPGRCLPLPCAGGIRICSWCLCPAISSAAAMPDANSNNAGSVCLPQRTHRQQPVRVPGRSSACS
jgi:3-deoxy-D-manno-octulosonic-acid transferase